MLTLIEGMAAGLPCVSTHVGGVPEILSHGENAWLCDAGDDQAIAHALKELAGDRRMRQSFGAAGRQVAIHRFSEQRMLQKYQQLFSDVLSRR